jgi:hypothetical protein
MPQILQHVRYTTSELQSERGSEGEILMDTTKKTLVVMDGTTNGGHPMAKASDIPVNISQLNNDAEYITISSVFSGSYNDLTDTPTLFSGAYGDLTGKPTLFSGAYADLTDKPTLFDGQYSSLSGIPSTFTPASHNQDFSTITNTPTTISGYGITDAFVQGSSEITVGNTHVISAISDTIIGIGPNDFRIDFGTALQNQANLENVDVIRLKPDTELRIMLADGSEWGFGTGGGIDFPDFTTQTTAYTGPQTSISGEAGSDLELSSNNDVNINTSVGNENHVFEFKGDGTFYMAKNPIGNTSIISTPRNDDNANLNLASALDVIIATNEATGSLENWVFGRDGRLTAPGSITVTTDGNGTLTSSSGYAQLSGDNGAELYFDNEALITSYIGVEEDSASIVVTDSTPGSASQSSLAMSSAGNTTLASAAWINLITNNGPSAKTFRFDSDGALTFPDATTQTTAYPGESSLTNVPYTDGTAGAWSNTAPTTVSEAIDRIANALYALGANTAI